MLGLGVGAQRPHSDDDGLDQMGPRPDEGLDQMGASSRWEPRLNGVLARWGLDKMVPRPDRDLEQMEASTRWGPRRGGGLD